MKKVGKLEAVVCDSLVIKKLHQLRGAHILGDVISISIVH